ncbi:PREDICTED: coiled-coil domain-containing protein 160 [Nanorana parkeri]|uniref:coiled-coil domain-containing protein 160 n=1 Tax=Nanorana parkeri TaxID=125878 RepID=UPI000854667E|nr:PREDICTED: coiled-coil domain-containing protein 160 [Nanorana parkeri]
MEDQKKHWVEELFTPRFTAQDLFYETFEPDLLLSEKLAKERAKAVQGIYQASLCKLQADEKLKRKETLCKRITQDYESSAQKKPTTTQSSTCAACQKLNSNSTDTVGDNKCIWSEQELKLLRHEMNKTHSEGTQLKLQLDAYKLELSQLKAKQKETKRELEAVRAELAASKRYTESKSVLLKQMQKEGAKKDAELQFLKKDLQDKTLMVHNLTNGLQKARKGMQDLQLQNNDLEYELKSLKQQQGLENIFAVENMKLKFSRKVNKLRKEIDSITSETEK